MLLVYVYLLLVVVEHAITYNFANRLLKDNCECSDSWKRGAVLGMTAFNFFTVFVSLIHIGNRNTYPASYVWFLSIYSILYLGVVFSYVSELKRKQCKCSNGMDADFIYYTRLIDIIMILLVIFLKCIGF